MPYPGTLGGAVPISTRGNKNTSGLPLYVTSNNKLPRNSRKMAYKERDKATSLYISYMVYMIITQTRCTMALFLAVISEEDAVTALLLQTHGPGKEILRLRRTQNLIQSDGTNPVIRFSPVSCKRTECVSQHLLVY